MSRSAKLTVSGGAECIFKGAEGDFREAVGEEGEEVGGEGDSKNDGEGEELAAGEAPAFSGGGEGVGRAFRDEEISEIEAEVDVETRENAAADDRRHFHESEDDVAESKESGAWEVAAQGDVFAAGLDRGF